MFRLAGLYTAIFLGVFLVYLMCISDVFDLEKIVRPQYLILIVYVSIFAYLLAPCKIFNPIGRRYVGRLFIRSLISPCIGVDFTIVWMTDQWQSLITPLRDTAYTICYYIREDFDKPDDDNPCT